MNGNMNRMYYNRVIFAGILEKKAMHLLGINNNIIIKSLFNVGHIYIHSYMRK